MSPTRPETFGHAFPFKLAERMERTDDAAVALVLPSAGGELTKLIGTSAWYAPASAVVDMVDAILKDNKKIVPCSVYLQGEYGINGLFVGVPVKLGAKGVEQIIQLKLSERS